MLTECWNSNLSNVDIKGYDCFECPRPKINRKAKRDSGGVIVYFKEIYRNAVELVSLNVNGILWFKLKKEYSKCENDQYFCVCYIPPEDSAVYRHVNSPLFDFDFFEHLNTELRKYSDLGDIYLLGDLNSRTGEEPDFISDLQLDRYVCMPENEDQSENLLVRENHDKHVNPFGVKLLTLCKQNNMCITNGRISPGHCTFHSVKRNKPIQSTVDYLITKCDNFKYISNMCVMDLTEYSDHCPIIFSLKCNATQIDSKCNYSYDKIVWDITEKDKFFNLLLSKTDLFDDIIRKLESSDIDVNQGVDAFSKLVHDLSFQSCGKTFSSVPITKEKKSPWFNEKCRDAKASFFRAKRVFKNHNSEENKLSFLKFRNEFAKAKRHAKNNFYNQEKTKLADVSKKSPRKFWKYIKKFKKRDKTHNNVSLSDFKNYFSTFSNSPNIQLNSDSERFSRDETVIIDVLDSPLTVNEIIKTISTLNRHKSCDYENNVADFFIDAKDFISPYLCIIFNKIFESGIYPEAWCKGIIVPIYKKGDVHDPSNYRGITLVNVIAKIFSLTLRNRINKWCEEENIFCDEQFGFRDNRSTADAIFLLHTIIQKVLSKKEKLWCAFIDYQRAFDTVVRDELWIKLLQSGVSCKMINMIRNIYSNVKCCVKISSSMSMSDFFDVTLGLKQGEPLSPLLFILFINDISANIDINAMTNKDLELLSMYMILFADDIVLFTTDPNSLQAQLDKIYDYSLKWGLKVNVNKTKVCVFEKRRTDHNNVFFINNENIEIVDNFTYLGVKFSYTGNLLNAVKSLSDQALKAYHNLMFIFDRVKLDIKTKLQLFNSMVVPILLYGSEIWGVYNFKEVDKLHIRFLKYLLGVRKQTPNMAIYGELGIFPLSIVAKERALKYWLKIKNSVNMPIFNAYIDQCNNVNISCWASRIHSILDHLGYSHIRLNFDTSMNYFPLLKRTLRDQFIQEWNTSLNNISKLDFYRQFKTTFSYETYLDKITNDMHRKQFTCLRLCSHNLEVELGRYSRLDRENRLCKMCNQNVTETEYHFLLCCTKYSQIRQKYLGNISWPSLNKFNSIMSCNSKKKLILLSKFIKEAFELRKNTLETVTVS